VEGIKRSGAKKFQITGSEEEGRGGELRGRKQLLYSWKSDGRALLWGMGGGLNILVNRDGGYRGG